MKISEYFDSKKRESAELVRQLQEHLKKWPEVKAEYDRIDAECISLAGKLNAERLAGSPKALATESELKATRWRRDGTKHDHSLQRNKLHTAIEALTGKPIFEFHHYCLDFVKNLSKLYRYERVEPSHDIMGRRVRFNVVISHNSEALSKARDRVFECMREIDGMKYRALADIEKKIKEFEVEFAAFNLSTMRIEEVSEHRAAEMEPTKESDDLDKGILLPGGAVRLLEKKGTDSKLDILAGRISKLEQAQ